MATVTVDQSKLILNAFAATFQNNLIAKDLVTWKKYDSEMDDRNGLKVVEQVGPRYNVTETTNGVKDLSAGVQDSVYGSEQFVVNKTFGSSMGWGDFVKIRDIGAARESEALKSAAVNLAEKIDAYVLRSAVLASNNWLGTPANGVDTFADIVQGYTRLKDEGVEDGAVAQAVLDGGVGAFGEGAGCALQMLDDLGCLAAEGRRDKAFEDLRAQRPANGLPAPVRAQIISLGLWVERFTSDVVAGREPIGELISLNRTIMEGLRGQRLAA